MGFALEVITSRWTFLRPWLSQLTMKYKEMGLDYDARGPAQRRIKVYLRRTGNDPEAEFQVKLQRACEGLALLAAVESVDHELWRYFLTEWCGLFLGEEGEEMLEEKISVRFLLDLDLQEQDGGSYDLVKICGTGQRVRPSDEYLKAMRKVAAMDRSLKDGKPGLDIEIPVMLCFHAREEKTMLHLENVAKAERTIHEQWELYYDSRGGEQPVESKMFRCTFVLEPMIADLYENGKTKEMAETVGKLLEGNVWFSQVKLPLRWMRGVEYDASGARAGIQSLIPRVFGSTRRSLKQANSRYRPCFKQQNSAGGFTQIGEIKISCDASTTEASAFEQSCSGLLACQTTRNLSMYVHIGSSFRRTRQAWWKWIAYSMFSRRAGEHSSVEALVLKIGKQPTVADMDVFSSLVLSVHPEEELFATPRGKVDEREATLRAGAGIRWQKPMHGKADRISEDMIFPYAIPHLRAFSDDGESKWVNVVIPGWGWCRVQRSCLEFCDHQTSNSASGNVTALTLHLFLNEVGNPEWLHRFLSVVGGPLKYLKLDVSRLKVDVNAILQRCPNLRKLSVQGRFFDVELDFGYFRQANEPVPSMKFYGLNVETLAYTLSDNSNALTRCLYKLRLHGLGHTISFTTQRWDKRFKALGRMLGQNETLERLTINGPPGWLNLAALRKHHLMPIGRTQQLPIQCRLAFLSALSPRQKSLKRARGSGGGAQQNLDQYVLSRIFAYAEPPVLRQVFAQTCRAGSVHWM